MSFVFQNVTCKSVVSKLWCLFFESVVLTQQWQAILVFSSIVFFFFFFPDHCKQQQAALDFYWEELVITQIISHVYNMYSAVPVEEFEGGTTV